MRTSHNFFSIRAQQHRFPPQRKNCNEEKEKEEGRIGKFRGTFLTLLRPSSPWKKREGKGGMISLFAPKNRMFRGTLSEAYFIPYFNFICGLKIFSPHSHLLATPGSG